MIFRTHTNSLYEIDFTGKRIRRLHGEKSPTVRMGQDGDWRPYESVHPDPIRVGEQVMIIWTPNVPLLEETVVEPGEVAMPTTITSSVKEIVNEEVMS